MTSPGADAASSQDQPCVHLTVHDSVARLCIHNPPVNAINSRVRRALWSSLGRLATDERASCVLITAKGDMFSGGGDLRELGQPEPEGSVTLTDLARRVENFGKPVVIALHGRVFGGGVLLAMACHARVAAPDAELALPEVNLGFVPGAGGTQRLPRLVGVENALRMVALARPLRAQEALEQGLIDRLSSDAGALPAQAAHVAREIAQGRREWRRTSALRVPGGPASDALIATLRGEAASRFSGREAPQAAIDLIAAAPGLVFEDGARTERETFARLSASAETRELLDAFFAARAAARAVKAAAVAP